MDNMYILKAYGPKGKIIYKLGYSKNIHIRMRSYRHCNPYIELIATGYAKDGLDYEQFVHKQVEAKVGNEWYEEKKLIKLKELLDQPEDLDIPSIIEGITEGVKKAEKIPYLIIGPSKIAEISGITVITVRKHLKYNKSLKTILNKINTKRDFITEEHAWDLVEFIRVYKDIYINKTPTQLRKILGDNREVINKFIKKAREYHKLEKYIPKIGIKKHSTIEDKEDFKCLTVIHRKTDPYLKVSFKRINELRKEHKKKMSVRDLRRVLAEMRISGELEKLNTSLPFTRKATADKIERIKTHIKNKKISVLTAVEVMRICDVKFETATKFKKLLDM